MIDQAYLDAVKNSLAAMQKESQFGLRGWAKYLKSSGQMPSESQQDEVPITKSLCEKLTSAGFPSRDMNYAGSRQNCDIVSQLSNGTEVWIEAKVYYTIWFDDQKDPTYSNVKLATGSGTFKGKIRNLIRDCTEKLQRLPPGVQAAGLILGFEGEPALPGVQLPPGCPSSVEIDQFMKSELSTSLPNWSIAPMELNGALRHSIPECKNYRFNTRPFVWTRDS